MIQHISSVCQQGDEHERCRVKVCACSCHGAFKVTQQVRVTNVDSPFFTWEGALAARVDDTHWQVVFVFNVTRFPAMTFKETELELVWSDL